MCLALLLQIFTILKQEVPVPYTMHMANLVIFSEIVICSLQKSTTHYPEEIVLTNFSLKEIFLLLLFLPCFQRFPQ